MKKILLLTALAALASPAAHGLGIRLADQDAFATGRGNAFVATADNPSAIYYNPAGITQLEGNNLSLGTYIIGTNFDYTSPLGRDVSAEDQVLAIPQIYYTYSHPDCPVSVGLGVYTPFGLAIDWPQDSGFRTVATESQLTYLTINPVVAWKIHKTFSIGAGVTVNYGDVDLQRGILFPGDRFKFTGDDWAAGFNFGARWQPVEQLAFGVNYRSETTIDFNGNSQASPYAPSESASAEFKFPQIFMAGVSFRPTPKWNIEFNIDYADWDSLNTVTLRQASGDILLPFNWNSSFMYEFGVTRYFDNGIHLSVGYMYSENSVPTADFSPAVPDSNRHVFSVGLGYAGERWSADLAYQLAYGPERTVSGSNSPSLIGQSGDGEYKFLSNAVSLSLGYKF